MDSFSNTFPIRPPLQADDKTRHNIPCAARSDTHQEMGLRAPGGAPQPWVKKTRRTRLSEEQKPTGFNVSFDRSQQPMDDFGQHLELILKTCVDAGLSPREQIAVEQILHAYDSNILALQAGDLPGHHVLSHFSHGQLVEIIQGFPQSLRNKFDEISLYFRLLQAAEFYHFALLDKEMIQDLVSFISSQEDRRVEELMAGAGWLHKALIEQGVDIVSSDNFSIRNSKTAFSEGLAKAFGIQEHYELMRPVPGATIRQCNAINALRESDRGTLLLCYPNPSPAHLRQLLEECRRSGKMIIHIAPDGESFDKLLPPETAGGRFEVIKEAPVSKIKTQVLEVGYWKESYTHRIF